MAVRNERFMLMAELAKLPKDMVFFTQITMESAEDGQYLDAMRKANIKGALVGIEAVTPEGLKAVYKDFNYSGNRLIEQLQMFLKHGLHVLGSFIFGLPTDKPGTFDATVELAMKADVTFAQFVMMTPFPGTVDFGRREKEQSAKPEIENIDGTPLTRYWLIPTSVRPKMLHRILRWVRARSATGRRRSGIVSANSVRSGSDQPARQRYARGWRLFYFRSSIARCMQAPESRPTAHVVKRPSYPLVGSPGRPVRSSRPNPCRN